MEISDLLYGPLYASFGAPAVLTLRPDAPGIPITAIDRTEGVEVSASGSIDVLTIKPAAMVRMSELTELGVMLADLDGATLLLNGRVRRIDSHMLKPGPQGDSAGEVYLILSDEDD